MSKGDELWRKREKFLALLYDKAAISEDSALNGEEIAEALAVDDNTVFAIARKLGEQELVEAQYGDVKLADFEAWLTGVGWEKGREAAHRLRRPRVGRA